VKFELSALKLTPQLEQIVDIQTGWSPPVFFSHACAHVLVCVYYALHLYLVLRTQVYGSECKQAGFHFTMVAFVSKIIKSRKLAGLHAC
jgi:hypothetical protein